MKILNQTYIEHTASRREQWKKIKENSNATYWVSNLGNCRKVYKKTYQIETMPGVICKSSPSYYRFCNDYVHRLVAKAFIPNPNNYEQVDHINNNRKDNRVSNLRWMSRQQNNTRPHAKKMRRLHARCTRRGDQFIKATKQIDGKEVVQFFKNGRAAAKAIGCSTVLIYRAANPDDYAPKARGWKLQWVSRQSNGAEKLARQILKEKQRQQRNNEMKRAKKAKLVKEEKRKAKAKKKLQKMVDKVNSRIEIWEDHLRDFDKRLEKKRSKYLAKIAALKEEQSNLEAKLED